MFVMLQEISRDLSRDFKHSEIVSDSPMSRTLVTRRAMATKFMASYHLESTRRELEMITLPAIFSFLVPNFRVQLACMNIAIRSQNG